MLATDGTSMTEREHKILLTKEEYTGLLDNYSGEQVLQVNKYFAPLDLTSKFDMVRIREKKGRFHLTVKTESESNDDIMISTERGVYITEEKEKEFLQKGIASPTFLEIFGIKEEYRRYIGDLITLRTILIVDGRKLELDQNTYNGTIDYEIEFETESEEDDIFFQDFLSRHNIPFRLSRPKFLRFIDTLSSIKTN